MRHDFKYDTKLTDDEQALRDSAAPFVAGQQLDSPTYTYLGYVFSVTESGNTATPPLLNTVNFVMSLESSIRRISELLTLESFSVEVDSDDCLTIGSLREDGTVLPLVVGSQSWCRSNLTGLSSNMLKVPLFALSTHLTQKP